MSGNSINIFEVGPRDGLQNEKSEISLVDKLGLINDLARVGLREIEIGAFVRADKVPRMADTETIYEKLKSGDVDLRGGRGWSLLSNQKGLDRAKAAGATHVAFFTAVTDGFNQKNVGKTVQESFDEARDIIQQARSDGMTVRGYLSTAFGCPFEGKVAASKTLKRIEEMLNLGVFQVSVGDTIGVATPKDVEAVFAPAVKNFGADQLAGHFHDTRGTALVNALKVYEMGVETIDASAGGLGGCPFAPGATGNLATEDLVYLIEGMGVKTGVDLPELCKVSIDMAKKLNRTVTSRYVQAFSASGY